MTTALKRFFILQIHTPSLTGPSSSWPNEVSHPAASFLGPWQREERDTGSLEAHLGRQEALDLVSALTSCAHLCIP